MKKLKWYQYFSIVMVIVGVIFIIVGFKGNNGQLAYVGMAITIGSISMYFSKGKPKKIEGE